MEGRRSFIHNDDNWHFTCSITCALLQPPSHKISDAQPSGEEKYILNELDQICDEHIAKVAKLFHLIHSSASWNPGEEARAAERFRLLNILTSESLEEESAKSVS